MNMCSVPTVVNNNPTFRGVGSRLLGVLPNITIKKPEILEKIGTTISRPDVSRAILGATALATQPFIDYHNPRVDKETAAVSACRTIAKIIACTTVGVLVRGSSLKLIKLFTNIGKNIPNWKKFLLPSEKIQNLLNIKNPLWIKNYRSTLANILALGAMLVTNVLVDVPVTNYLSNKFINKREQGKLKKAESRVK